MNSIILPISTALWLKQNTKLTAQQIAIACDLNILEVLALDDNTSMIASDPIKLKQFTAQNIAECEKNQKAMLIPILVMKPKFIISRLVLSGIKIDAYINNIISWLLYNYPDIKTKAIAKLLLISNVKVEELIEHIKDNNMMTFKNPIEMKLCTIKTLNEIIYWADMEDYKNKIKKLTLEQIAGIANWLKKEYNISHMSHIYYIMNFVKPEKIQKAIQKFRGYYNPIENNIMTENYLKRYKGYVLNIDYPNSSEVSTTFIANNENHNTVTNDSV